MSKNPKMIHYEHFKSAINGNNIFDANMFENCIQLQFYKDGSVDLFDFITEKFLGTIK